VVAEVLTQPAFHQVPLHGVADPLADDHTGTRLRMLSHRRDTQVGSGRGGHQMHDEWTAPGAATPGGHEPVLGPATNPR
jgi:hypothetical protein